MISSNNDNGDQGPILHFAHANAYTPGAYQTMLDLLSENYRVKAIKFRPISAPQTPKTTVRNWKIFSTEIIQYFKSQSWEKVLGIGHSLGAVATIIAAAQKPHLFKKIVLIDPVILPQKIYRFNNIVPINARKYVNPVSKIALKRKDQWASKQEAFEHFRRKKVFSRISDENLKIIIENATHLQENDTVTLTFSKQWESRIYDTPTNPRPYLKKIKVPFLIIRAGDSNVISAKVWEEIQQINPNGKFINIDNKSHLIPFEDPELIANIAYEFFKE